MLPPMPKPMGALPPSVSARSTAAAPPPGPPPASAVNRAMLDSASKMLEEVKRRQAELDEAQAMMRAAQDLQQAVHKKRPRQPSGPPPKHKIMRGSAGVQVTLKAKAAPLPPGASSSASSSWQQQDRIDEPTYIRSVV